MPLLKVPLHGEGVPLAVQIRPESGALVIPPITVAGESARNFGGTVDIRLGVNPVKKIVADLSAVTNSANPIL